MGFDHEYRSERPADSGRILRPTHADRGLPQRRRRRLLLGPIDDPLERAAERGEQRRSVSTPLVPPPALALHRAACVARPRGPSQSSATTEESSTTRSPGGVRRAGGGRPLAPALQTDMQSAFGTDLGGVRVRRTPRPRRSAPDWVPRPSHSAATSTSAQAHPRWTTADGTHLLAHELTHVVQQQPGRCSACRS